MHRRHSAKSGRPGLWIKPCLGHPPDPGRLGPAAGAVLARILAGVDSEFEFLAGEGWAVRGRQMPLGDREFQRLTSPDIGIPAYDSDMPTIRVSTMPRHRRPVGKKSPRRRHRPFPCIQRQNRLWPRPHPFGLLGVRRRAGEAAVLAMVAFAAARDSSASGLAILPIAFQVG